MDYRALTMLTRLLPAFSLRLLRACFLLLCYYFLCNKYEIDFTPPALCQLVCQLMKSEILQSGS
jgi:drug/metabolite transporter (DMT)-like permease